ncbi:hypothetical protein [Streptomyces anulatus]
MGLPSAALQSLLSAARTYLGGSISLMWDSLLEHVSTEMCA